jgi:hypothetical protein
MKVVVPRPSKKQTAVAFVPVRLILFVGCQISNLTRFHSSRVRRRS